MSPEQERLITDIAAINLERPCNSFPSKMRKLFDTLGNSYPCDFGSHLREYRVKHIAVDPMALLDWGDLSRAERIDTLRAYVDWLKSQ